VLKQFTQRRKEDAKTRSLPVSSYSLRLCVFFASLRELALAKAQQGGAAGGDCPIVHIFV
jgi:hypothetical protein